MAVHIFTRDLRVKDNNSLNELAKQNLDIYPVFIFTPTQVKNNNYKSDNAIQFMVESLKNLHIETNETLGLFYGSFQNIVNDIIKKNNPSAMSITKDYTPFAIERETALKKICYKNEIRCIITEDYCLNPPGSIKLYQKYTPYKNVAIEMIKTLKKPLTRKVKFLNINGNFDFKKASLLYTNNTNLNKNGGRFIGLNQLKILNEQKDYDNSRNLLIHNTTELSAFIKFGCLSIREVYFAIKKKIWCKRWVNKPVDMERLLFSIRCRVSKSFTWRTIKGEVYKY
jgi:deoxyribodipyrimidine photo-lyase